MKIVSSHVNHLIPTIGLRIEFPRYKNAVAYSSDTETCQQVVRLSASVDVRIHEATGASHGHSSASQAGEIAQMAKVDSFLLIHYPTNGYSTNNLIAEARQNFSGQISLAEDYLILSFE